MAAPQCFFEPERLGRRAMRRQMDQCSRPETVQTPRTDNEARREALKRFGRYAAVAPAAMLLLDPGSGHTYPSPNDNSQGHNKKNKNKKNKNKKRAETF
jgi:hypothetical protein